MATIEIDLDRCTGCGSCMTTCPVEMYAIENGKIKITKDMSECAGCHACENVCPNSAIKIVD